MDGISTISDSRYETRELGFLQLFDEQREHFIRAEVYNLRRSLEQQQLSCLLRFRAIYWLGNTPETAAKKCSFRQVRACIKSLGALTNAIQGDGQAEIQKQAVIAIGRRPKDEAIPILIRTEGNHPRMDVRKQAIRVLGQTGDERAVAFFQGAVKQLNA